jgi:hypothetical protein
VRCAVLIILGPLIYSLNSSHTALQKPMSLIFTWAMGNYVRIFRAWRINIAKCAWVSLLILIFTLIKDITKKKRSVEMNYRKLKRV